MTLRTFNPPIPYWVWASLKRKISTHEAEICCAKCEGPILPGQGRYRIGEDFCEKCGEPREETRELRRQAWRQS